MDRPTHSPLDRFLIALDGALKALTSTPSAAREIPSAADPSAPHDVAERRLSGALMRVNHVGEVCAQALYAAQSIATANPQLRRQFQAAAAEEGDHLAWTAGRLRELGARPSLLNPLWYAGSFAIGLLAGSAGDRTSLGFVVETERQIERHLSTHLERLPADDLPSRAIVQQMKADEARHGLAAENAGAAPLPLPLRLLMRATGRVMTTTAHYI